MPKTKGKNPDKMSVNFSENVPTATETMATSQYFTTLMNESPD